MTKKCTWWLCSFANDAKYSARAFLSGATNDDLPSVRARTRYFCESCFKHLKTRDHIIFFDEEELR